MHGFINSSTTCKKKSSHIQGQKVTLKELELTTLKTFPLQLQNLIW